MESFWSLCFAAALIQYRYKTQPALSRGALIRQGVLLKGGVQIFKEVRFRRQWGEGRREEVGKAVSNSDTLWTFVPLQKTQF